jgi:hypothetical protein
VLGHEGGEVHIEMHHQVPERGEQFHAAGF